MKCAGFLFTGKLVLCSFMAPPFCSQELFPLMFAFGGSGETDLFIVIRLLNTKLLRHMCIWVQDTLVSPSSFACCIDEELAYEIVCRGVIFKYSKPFKVAFKHSSVTGAVVCSLALRGVLTPSLMWILVLTRPLVQTKELFFEDHLPPARKLCLLWGKDLCWPSLS